MAPVEIRDCAEEDLAALEEEMPAYGVHAQLFARQNRSEASYLVARSAGRVVGAGLIRWAGHRNAESRAALPGSPVISNLGVVEAMRGQGVGSALIAAAEQRIRDRGYRQVSIAVEADNVGARRLYRRLGYVDTWLRELSRYDAPDPVGTPHRVEERNLLLRKRLH